MELMLEDILDFCTGKQEDGTPMAGLKNALSFTVQQKYVWTGWINRRIPLFIR